LRSIDVISGNAALLEISHNGIARRVLAKPGNRLGMPTKVGQRRQNVAAGPARVVCYAMRGFIPDDNV
jgi:hypothetical protein